LTLLWSRGLMSPWRAKLLMCRTMPDGQVPSGPIHMGRWLVRTSMGLKSPSDGCWDLIRGRDRTVIGRAFAREKKKDIFIQDALAEPNLRGLIHCRWNVSLCWPKMSSRDPRRHLQCLAALQGSLARVAEFGGPEWANVCFPVLRFALKRANVSLEGARRAAYCSFRVFFRQFNVKQYDF